MPTLQRLLLLQEFLATPQVKITFGQLKGWSCARLCQHTQSVSVSSCPTLSWYALKCPWHDLAAISYPRTSHLSLSSGRDFTRQVGFRPSSTYVCAAPENVPFCHSNCQLISFIFLIFRLALLRDWCRLSPAARSSFAYFFASWSANSFPSIPAWPGLIGGCSSVNGQSSGSVTCRSATWW